MGTDLYIQICREVALYVREQLKLLAIDRKAVGRLLAGLMEKVLSKRTPGEGIGFNRLFRRIASRF